jgi:hypothetical protein
MHQNKSNQNRRSDWQLELSKKCDDLLDQIRESFVPSFNALNDSDKVKKHPRPQKRAPPPTTKKRMSLIS